jgi:hypothetical protein
MIDLPLCPFWAGGFSLTLGRPAQSSESSQLGFPAFARRPRPTPRVAQSVAELHALVAPEAKGAMRFSHNRHPIVAGGIVDQGHFSSLFTRIA